MSQRNHNGLLVVAFACLTLFGGCPTPEQQKEANIDALIEGGNSEKSDVLSQSGGACLDYRVYRDGSEDGVVFEYVFSPGAAIDRSQLTPENIKSEMIREINKDYSSRVVLKSGVYLRFLYKTSGGEVICDARLTGDDI